MSCPTPVYTSNQFLNFANTIQYTLKQEEEAAAEILKDFVASFDDSKKNMPKMFVKGAVSNTLTKGNLTTKPIMF
jgi:hypothetical protein